LPPSRLPRREAWRCKMGMICILLLAQEQLRPNNPGQAGSALVRLLLK
jgi:hypothetical protein